MNYHNNRPHVHPPHHVIERAAANGDLGIHYASCAAMLGTAFLTGGASLLPYAAYVATTGGIHLIKKIKSE